MGLNCPSLLDWECGKRAARARRYAFWASMNSANLRAVVMTWHRSGNKNNLAIGSDGSEWTTRGIGLSMTINVPVVKTGGCPAIRLFSCRQPDMISVQTGNTQRGHADSVPLTHVGLPRDKEFFRGATVGASARPRTARPPTRSNARVAGKQGGGSQTRHGGSVKGLAKTWCRCN